MKFEERPIYRNLIGKLLLNNQKPSAAEILLMAAAAANNSNNNNNDEKSAANAKAATAAATKFTNDMSELHSAKTLTSMTSTSATTTMNKGGLGASANGHGTSKGTHLLPSSFVLYKLSFR